MSNKFLNGILIILPLFIGILLWILLSVKWCLLFYGMYSLGMYIHITATTLSNAFIGREINVGGDLFWKVIFLILTCLCMTLFFYI